MNTRVSGFRDDHGWGRRPAFDFRGISRRRIGGHAHGFTVVELLVVAAIIAMLFGMILAGTRTGSGGDVRRAAQEFASVLLATQARGIGNAAGAGLVMASEGTRATEVFNGDIPPPVLGDVGSGLPPDGPATQVNVSITPTNGGDLERGFRVQFFGKDPTVPASAWFGFKAPGTVTLRSDDGQAPANTVWPKPVGEESLRARVAGYPSRGDTVMTFRKTVGLDLRYSGTGDDPTADWGGLANQGDLGLSFDSVGSVFALIRGIGGTATARQPIEPVYWLVALRTDIDADASLASDRSLWVVVQPQTGRVTISGNVPQSSKDRVAVRAARANARAMLVAGK